MCVLSSCPGGTASNIVAYIAKGEMGLSIMMTTASTLAAIVMTPLITTWLAGTLVPVDPKALFMSTLQVRDLWACLHSRVAVNLRQGGRPPT